MCLIECEARSVAVVYGVGFAFYGEMSTICIKYYIDGGGKDGC